MSSTGPYTPHMDGPNVRMGLSPLSAEQWMQPDAEWSRYHQHKCELGQSNRARVYSCLPESVDAVAELGPLLRDHLLQDHASLFELTASDGLCHRPSGTVLACGDSSDLWTVSTWVQEDLLILLPQDGAYRLVAGSLCLPSRWSLTEKMGQPLHTIHAPVPTLNDTLGERIDRFFNHLRVDRPVMRFNWSLQSDAALADFPGPNAPTDDVHYRVERQTMRRLPETGAVVFGVRIYVEPIARIAAIPGAIEQLRLDIAAMPDAFQAYKRLPLFHELLAEL